jgi:hypothetical protein
MNRFTDGTGREWAVDLNIAAFERIRSQTPADLYRLDEGDPPLAVRLSLDDGLLADVLWSIVEPDAVQRQITRAQFIESLTPEVTAEAERIFWEQLADFSRRRGRTWLVKLIEARTALLQQIEREAAALSAPTSGASPDCSASTPGT